MKPLHAVHVVPHIDDEASGPSYSVPRLCQSLAQRGHRVGLMCLRAPESVPGVELEVYRQWRVPARFAVSTQLARALRERADQVDIVHNHSLWSMANVAAGWVVPGRRAKLVTSPRGTLSDWALAHSRAVKRALWPLQRRALASADLLHATSDEEYGEIRALGLAAPVVVVPNGIDIPAIPERPGRTRSSGPGSLRTLLFLSRIHPKKGIDRLLHAWQRLHPRFPDWQLVIAGRGDPAHVAQVTELAAGLHLPRVHFPGPLYGEEKSAAYAAADLFVLPTHSENFGMVVAEALAHGCPAVVSRGAPWSGLQAHRCGWWIDHPIEALTSALDIAMALGVEEREQMGGRGRSWMMDEYGWDSVAQRMSDAYLWLASSGARPETVRIRE